MRHDDARNNAGNLASQTLTKGRVSCDPLIKYGRDASAMMPWPATTTGNHAGEEARGDVLIHGLWIKGNGCVLVTWVTDTDVRSYSDLSSSKVPKNTETMRKDKYLAPCLAMWKGFMPLVYSVDGMAGKEAKSFERRIASLLAVKWDRPYSEMVGYVRGRMGLAIIRHNTRLLRGSRLKYREVPDIEDAAG